MKAIIEVELEIDGELQEGDIDRIANHILAEQYDGIYLVDPDRLIVIPGNMSVEIV